MQGNTKSLTSTLGTILNIGLLLSLVMIFISSEDMSELRYPIVILLLFGLPSILFHAFPDIRKNNIFRDVSVIYHSAVIVTLTLAMTTTYLHLSLPVPLLPLIKFIMFYFLEYGLLFSGSYLMMASPYFRGDGIMGLGDDQVIFERLASKDDGFLYQAQLGQFELYKDARGQIEDGALKEQSML